MSLKVTGEYSNPGNIYKVQYKIQYNFYFIIYKSFAFTFAIFSTGREFGTDLFYFV